MGEQPKEKNLYLVDGTSQLFRAYFAIRGLSNDEGLPTNAVYGFTTMLRKLLKEESPPFMAVAFDLPGRTFRHERFADYKAHRPPPPEDLSVQVPYAKQVCRALRLHVLELAGYEADDLIATYARLGCEAGYRVTVVASDKDLLQLVCDEVTVLNPTKNVRLDAAAVAQSFGVPPERVRDVLALMGDSVDNIPGIPGVGEKTATAMVAASGALEAVLARAERFVGAFDARDALLAAIVSAEKEESLTEADAGRLRTSAEAFLHSLSLLAREEPDESYRTRLEAVLALADPLRPVLLEVRAGQAGRALGKHLRELRRALVDLDRGSGRKLWYAVEANAEKAILSRELATLDAAVPVSFDPQSFEVGPPDREQLDALFRSLGFKTLLAELSKNNGQDVAVPEVRGSYETVLTREALASAVAAAREAGRVALDTETDGPDPMRARLVGISLTHAEGRGFYVPLGHGYLGAPQQLSVEEVREILGPLLADRSVGKVGQNFKYDLHVLRRHGMHVEGWELDTMVAAFLLDPGRTSFSLEALAKDVMGYGTLRSQELAAGGAKHRSVDEVDVERVTQYGGEDADVCLRLARVLTGRLRDEGLLELYRTIDGPLLPVLARMEAHGIRIDTGVLGVMSREMEEALDRSRLQIQRLAGVELNPDSPKQLREVLFEKLGLATRHTTAKGGVPSTDAVALEELADEHEIARAILAYRELAKLKGTYVDSLPLLVNPETGRVHTSFNPTGAATGRLSSSDPNLQNIPARTEMGLKIRSAFVPDPGFVLVSSDYSQVELRVLAHLCGDPELVAAFQAGEDIHRRTASRVFGVAPELVSDTMRRRAKAVNFGILYGMSETRLARDQGISRTEARRFIHAYFERFQGVKAYIEKTRAAAQLHAEVRTRFERVRRFPQLRARAGRAVREQALRAAVNTTIQGTAADLMKLAMLRVDRALEQAGLRTRMLLQVHDELLFEVPEDEVETARRLIRSEMEAVFPLTVPLAVDQKVGRSWMEVT